MLRARRKTRFSFSPFFTNVLSSTGMKKTWSRIGITLCTKEKLDERGGKFLRKRLETFVTGCHANGGFQRLQGLIDRANEISSGQRGNCTRCAGGKEIEKARGRFSVNF